MRLGFLPSFWGLLHIASHHTLKDCSHVIISSSIPRKEMQIKSFHMIDLYSPEFFTRLRQSSQQTIPAYHVFSASHYARYQESVYAQYMTYADFCVLEEKMGDVVWSYLGDETQSWMLRLPPIFLHVDSVQTYLNHDLMKKTCWITPSKTVGNPDYIAYQVKPSDAHI